MRVLTVVDERFDDYKKPSMFIGTISCSGKCCIEAGIPMTVCQNDGWRSCAPVDIDNFELCERYFKNNITEAVVFGGLEPFEQFNEIEEFIHDFRIVFRCNDDIVIYTGYYPSEIQEQLNVLSFYKNIIVKFGRFIPNSESKFDDILGVTLVSDNQYAERIS